MILCIVADEQSVEREAPTADNGALHISRN